MDSDPPPQIPDLTDLDAEHVAGLVDRLAEPDKLVAALVLCEGHHPSEAAEQLGLTDEEVARRLRRIVASIIDESSDEGAS